MRDFIADVPVEVTLVDGSRWIVYYRLRSGQDFADAIGYIKRDIQEGRLNPAEDLDRVQRRSSQINMSYVVSVREAENPATAERDEVSDQTGGTR